MFEILPFYIFCKNWRITRDVPHLPFLLKSFVFLEKSSYPEEHNMMMMILNISIDVWNNCYIQIQIIYIYSNYFIRWFFCCITKRTFDGEQLNGWLFTASIQCLFNVCVRISIKTPGVHLKIFKTITTPKKFQKLLRCFFLLLLLLIFNVKFFSFDDFIFSSLLDGNRNNNLWEKVCLADKVLILAHRFSDFCSDTHKYSNSVGIWSSWYL